jgi:hypothetical protein
MLATTFSDASTRCLNSSSAKVDIINAAEVNCGVNCCLHKQEKRNVRHVMMLNWATRHHLRPSYAPVDWKL